MSMFGKVHVKANQYRLQGNFHHLSPSLPIRNADDDWKLMGITNPRDMTYIHSYGGEAIFFASLGKGQLLASRCDQADCPAAGTLYLPFRIHCPDCLGKNSPVDITDIARKTATIHTFMTCARSGAFNSLEKPMTFINVEFDQVATILMSYLVLGEPAIGTRVVPIFKQLEPTSTILDLAWVVEGTSRHLLPEGFCL
ncbi:MAG: Zn-ribbon domain-containing OB-fold protein [Desulfopila sp.]